MPITKTYDGGNCLIKLFIWIRSVFVAFEKLFANPFKEFHMFLIYFRRRPPSEQDAHKLFQIKFKQRGESKREKIKFKDNSVTSSLLARRNGSQIKYKWFHSLAKATRKVPSIQLLIEFNHPFSSKSLQFNDCHVCLWHYVLLWHRKSFRKYFLLSMFIIKN